MRCFLSYSRKDKSFAAKLVNDLKEYGHLEVWWDTRINPSSEWDQTLQEEINRADIFLVALSPNAVDSENVLNEIVYAKQTKKRIIPLLAFKCDIPLLIIRIQWVDFTGNYAAGLDELVKSIPGVEAKLKQDAERLGPARAKVRKQQIRAIIFILLPVGLLLTAWIIWLNQPLKGISIVNETGYKIAYEVSNGNMVFNIKSSDIPSIAVDVNGNRKIDSGVDRSYGIAGFSTDALCPSYFMGPSGALTICNGAPSMASLQRSGSRYSFTIPLDELGADSTSGAIRVQFYFFDPRRGITRLFPARTELTDFSKMFKINTVIQPK